MIRVVIALRRACSADRTVTLARTSYHPLMAKLVFGMSQSLDGYVDDAARIGDDVVRLTYVPA